MRTMTELDVRKIKYMADLIGRTKERDLRKVRIDILSGAISIMIKRGVSEAEILDQLIKSYEK